jgi:signal transduction histidine kinase
LHLLPPEPAAEPQGRDLARDGIPAECVAAALTRYVEAGVQWLPPGDPRAIAALLRWAAQRQFELLTPYSREVRATETALEEKFVRYRRQARQFSARLAEAYEKERRRLAHDLHDEIGHDLIVLKLYTETIALDLRKGNTGALRRKVKDSISLIKHALAGVRSLTFDLGPAVWDEQGFLPAVRVYTRQFARRTGIKVHLRTARGFSRLAARGDLPPSHEIAFYKVLQGAMSNVAAHSGAKNVTIFLSTTKDTIQMRITDDGRGFDVERKMRSRAHSFGLRAIKSRIELLGGSVEFKSTQVHDGGQYEGTTIRVCVPANDFDGDEGTNDSPGL